MISSWVQAPKKNFGTKGLSLDLFQKVLVRNSISMLGLDTFLMLKKIRKGAKEGRKVPKDVVQLSRLGQAHRLYHL